MINKYFWNEKSAHKIYYIMRDTLSNVISDELQISLRLLYPDLSKHTLNRKTIEYPIENQSFQGHEKKMTITTTTKTIAKCDYFL